MTLGRRVGLRWTIGSVHPRGFEALQLSIWGAWRIFGDDALYGVCVNGIAVPEACERTGRLPVDVIWHDATHDLPAFLMERFDENLAEGTGWKLAPPRFFGSRYEIALDNDCILWGLPGSLREWLLEEAGECLVGEDVRAMFGRFQDLCGDAPRNAGIRGMPPGFDLGGRLQHLLRQVSGPLASELDEQGLQVAALGRSAYVVPLADLSICSPFPPHLPSLGVHGAHFVGLNAHRLPWNYEGRPATELISEHWAAHRNTIAELVGLKSF